MAKKKQPKSKILKLDEAQNNSMSNNSALAPNTRPDYSKTPVDKNTGRIPFAPSPFPSALGATGYVSEGESSFESGAKMQTTAVGNSGTQIFGGYFSEDYLNELHGRTGMRKWDEIRRSEAQVSMLLNAITNPIKAANWAIEPYEQGDPECEKHAELCDHVIFDQIDWNTFKHEALTVLPFGFSLFEVVHVVEFNHPKFGTFNGLKALAFRSQKTIENWQLEPKTGRLRGVNQYTYSDLGGNQFLPGEFLLVFTHSKEGDNYEGISVLRPIYGAWKRKDLYLKLTAIGVERYAIGTPIGTIPKGKERTTEVGEFSKLLQNYTSHETSYIIKPEGWNIEIQKADFKASEVKELITLENTEMANALVANFLALGMNGGGGAYALGSNLGEFFTSGIQSYADIICDGINRCLLPNLVKLNFGEQKGYPKLKCTGISDKAGKELAEVIKTLADARALNPDKPLMEFLRKQYKLPKEDLQTAIKLPAIPAGASANYPKEKDPVRDPVTGKTIPYSPSQLDNDPTNDAKMSGQFSEIKLADKKYVQKFDNNKELIKDLMIDNLEVLYANLKQALRKKYNSLNGSQKILAAKGLETPGLNAYKSALRDALTAIAQQVVADAKKTVPKNKKLSEPLQLAAKKFDPLSPAVRKQIDAQTSLVVETQAADIEKKVFFTFTSSATNEEDIDAILFDVDGEVLPVLEAGAGGGMNIDAAAGDILAQVAQNAAMDFFKSDAVVDQVESFTFTNEDPVSEICQSLEGTTFDINDPDLDTYSPPLHHNCKSRLVPNYKGDDGNPEIDRDGLSLSKKALASITLSDKKRNRK